MSNAVDCCFCVGSDWFRYRVGAIIISQGHALFSYSEREKYYYSVGGGIHLGERSDHAVIREVFEETGEHFEIQRPLCMAENFFMGTGALENLRCHTIELYYLMKAPCKKEYTVKSINTGGDSEKMVWLPIDRLDSYDIRPPIAAELAKNPPAEFICRISDRIN